MNIEKVKLLNDSLRKNGVGGQVMLTRGITQREDKEKIIKAVMDFEDFSEDNDPYGEHDFGKVVVDGIDYLWKIDYYDLDCKYHSEDKSDPKVTRRVLTIMEASEY
jgi:hypothetical protein